MRSAGFKTVEERIEGPAYPEVFLDVLFCGAKPVGSCEKQVAAFAFARCQYGLKPLCHCSAARLPFFIIGPLVEAVASARRTGRAEVRFLSPAAP